jgi:hypothetical protein
METYKMTTQELSRFQWVEMAVFDSSGLTGTYQALNGASQYLIYTGSGFPDSIKSLKIYNGSNVGITISFDGVTRQDFWPAGATIILDVQANHANNSAYGSGTLNGAQGQVIYGTGSAGVGNVYISAYR